MEPMIQACIELLERLHKDMKAAIDGLPPEALDWLPGEGMNSIGVLVTHTAGAERYWIGDLAGGDPSGRVRSQEFQANRRSALDLITLLDRTLEHSVAVLEALNPDSLGEVRESPAHGRSFSVSFAILHAIDHTATHLGHVQLTRQLWEQKGSAG